jgi:hypothetical protein
VRVVDPSHHRFAQSRADSGNRPQTLRSNVRFRQGVQLGFDEPNLLLEVPWKTEAALRCKLLNWFVMIGTPLSIWS